MPEQLANRNDNNLEMKKQQPQHNNQQKQTTREQKAKQRLANRAKRNAANQNLKTKIFNKSSSSSPIPKSKNNQAKSQQSSPYSDQQNVSLPEITTKISGTEKTNNNNKICVRYDQKHHASRHASPGASSITGI